MKRWLLLQIVKFNEPLSYSKMQNYTLTSDRCNADGQFKTYNPNFTQMGELKQNETTYVCSLTYTYNLKKWPSNIMFSSIEMSFRFIYSAASFAITVSEIKICAKFFCVSTLKH